MQRSKDDMSRVKKEIHQCFIKTYNEMHFRLHKYDYCFIGTTYVDFKAATKR